MLLIYYDVTDWRLATIGTISGGILSQSLFVLAGPAVPPLTQDQHAAHAVVFAFVWSIALLLNLSQHNLRRTQLANTIAAMGITAQELRTPLSTVDLLGDAIQMELKRLRDSRRVSKLEKFALRLLAVVRNQVVRETIAAYPFQSSHSREWLGLKIHCNFTFLSPAGQFPKMLNNLIKNTLNLLF